MGGFSLVAHSIMNHKIGIIGIILRLVTTNHINIIGICCVQGWVKHFSACA